MRVQSTVHYDDISATFSATMVKDDYGVPGSPTWWSPEDITLEEVTILDVTFSGKQIDTLPEKLVEHIMEVMLESVEEWDE
jgi:hypothetical protein